MGFIREEIKDKPINKKKLASRMAMAVLCGVVFALTVCGTVLALMPSLEAMLVAKDTEQLEPTEAISTQVTETTEEILSLPPEYSMSLKDYDKLQNELSKIGQETSLALVSIGNSGDWKNATKKAAQGTGAIIKQDNNYLYILTQVIGEKKKLHVWFADKTGADAKILEVDNQTGLAVLTVEKRQLQQATLQTIEVAELGSSYELKKGSLVIALGNFTGSSGEMFFGNLGSVDNQISMQDKNLTVITTDIPASKNSRGVLVNTKGELVGIVLDSVVEKKDAGCITAVAIEDVSAEIALLRDGKSIPYIGIYISTITEEIAKAYELPQGVFVREVTADSPAMKAGLQSGDIITHINGEEVTSDVEYSEKISQMIPSTACEIVVRRQNGTEYYEVTCEVTIEVLKEETK